MNSNQTLLNVSIYYRGSSKSKTALKKRLSAYSQRLLNDPWEFPADICLDTFHTKKEKQVQQELMSDTIITNTIKQMLPTIKEIYTVIVLLISLARQRVFENNPNPKADAWLILSIVPANTDEQAKIQWSLGQ